MTGFQRGNVILVSIAFSGAVGYKKRPAVIISTDAFNTAGTKLIVAAITSNISPPFWVLEIQLLGGCNLIHSPNN